MFGTKQRRIEELERSEERLQKELRQKDAVIELFRRLAIGTPDYPTYRGVREPRDPKSDGAREIRDCVLSLQSLGYLKVRNGKFVR